MKIIMIIWGALGVVALVVFGLLYALMSSNTPSGLLQYGARYDSALQATISGDGQMVAVIQVRPNAEELQVRHLANDKEWRKIPLPPLTKNIQFGLTGYELFIVFRKNETNTDVLAKLDLAQPSKPKEIIYEDSYLSYPVEVSQNKIMVRTMLVDSKTGKLNRYASSGILVEKNKVPVPLGEIDLFAPGTPSIVGTGFFYFLDSSVISKDNPSHIRSYALPNGKAPVINETFVDKMGQPRPFQTTTSSYFCDNKAERCLRGYVTDPNSSPYVYAVEIFQDQKRCPLPGVHGYFESKSITSTGNAAVFALSGEPGSRTRSPRIFVANFKSHQCAPVSVQQFNFEEK